MSQEYYDRLFGKYPRCEFCNCYFTVEPRQCDMGDHYDCLFLCDKCYEKRLVNEKERIYLEEIKTELVVDIGNSEEVECDFYEKCYTIDSIINKGTYCDDCSHRLDLDNGIAINKININGYSVYAEVCFECWDMKYVVNDIKVVQC